MPLSPATVVTIAVDTATTRMAWLFTSPTYTLVALPARPVGLLKPAFVPLPSVEAEFLPTHVEVEKFDMNICAIVFPPVAAIKSMPDAADDVVIPCERALPSGLMRVRCGKVAMVGRTSDAQRQRGSC